MKNRKLNNLIRRFMTLAYIVAVTAGITLGIFLPENWGWSILLVPLFTSFLLLLAYFINIWVEHRYVTYPFERTAQDTIEANKVLVKELDNIRLLYNNSVPEVAYNRLVHAILQKTEVLAKEIPQVSKLHYEIVEELADRREFHKKKNEQETRSAKSRFKERLEDYQKNQQNKNEEE